MEALFVCVSLSSNEIPPMAQAVLAGRIGKPSIVVTLFKNRGLNGCIRLDSKWSEYMQLAAESARLPAASKKLLPPPV